MKPLRVLQVHNAYRNVGGEDAVVAAEGDMLRRSGHDVVNFHVTNDMGGATSAASLLASPWNPISARAVRAAVRSCAPDIAHVHNTWFRLSPSVVAALGAADVPVVMTLHNYRLVCMNGLLFRDGRPCYDCVGTSPWNGVRHRCYKESTVMSTAAAATISVNRMRHTWSDAVDRFIAPSQHMKDIAVAGGLRSGQIVVRPHAVTDVGSRVSPPSSSSLVLYAGRISEEKGLGFLLDAWATAHPQSLELVVAGEGPSRIEFERRAIEGVRFTGWLPPQELHRLMLNARALVFPSLSDETFGFALVEAMSAGLPVIATARAGAREIVSEIGHEWLVEPGNVGAWVDVLGNLVDGSGLDAAGVRGRAIYESRYAPDRGLASLLDVYHMAISAHDR
jgi:glycosyltransferase involved in cell wall biosynthesis